MRTVGALFDTYDEVAAAVDGLSDMGVPANDITVVSQGRGSAAKIVEGAGLGAAIGGVGGILAGLGAFAIPGFGAMVGVGWLVPLLLGATAGGVAGGIIGVLTGSGIDEQDAHVYAEGVRRGSTFVAARVHDEEVAKVFSMFRRCGAIDTNSRRGEYASGGWDGFVAGDIWDDDIGSEDSRPNAQSSGNDARSNRAARVR
jgi:uncharacterized membrane protein